MRMRTAEAIALGIVIVSFALGFILWGRMPEVMASHWNASNEVDGYMSKFWGLFFAPFIILGLYLLFLAIPRIDPLRHNIEAFKKYFDGFIVTVLLFMLYLYVITLLWNAGQRFYLIRLLAPGFAVLFVVIGFLLEHVKPNWFVGIRTPWTLSDERVWEKTHIVGGKLFKFVGVLSLLGIPFPHLAVYFVLVPVLVVAAYLIVYSYVEYRRERGEQRSH